MPTEIVPSRYKDQDALTISSGMLSAQLIPAIGSTMTSLRWLPSGLELLRRRPGARYLVGKYGGSFVEAERAGFDEMLPTIDACPCDSEPWLGTAMPDHGEVWSIPWECRTDGASVLLSVSGVRFPYTMEKRMCFVAPDTLRIDYRLENRSPFDFPFLWAAHPDFALPVDARIELPAGVTRLVRVLGDGGAPGEEVRWPMHAGQDGVERDLRIVRATGVSRFAKYYVTGPLQEGWCRLAFPGLGVGITLSFPVDRVPYLGLLPNECGADGLSEVFIEPCTASYDRPDRARQHGELSVLPGRGSYEWHLEVVVGAIGT